jgi:glycosyltransferase involved in cell wall biosynthesis
MRIAMVSEHASPLAAIGGVDAGGQNIHVAELALALGRRGHDVVVYTRRDDAALPVQVQMAPRVLVEHLPAGPPRALPKDELIRHVPELAAGLTAALVQRRADVVHAHFWMSGVAASAAVSAAAVPLVQTFHALGTVKRRFQGTADTSPVERIRQERRLARTATRVIASCTDERRELLRLGAPAGRIDVVPSGVDLTSFGRGPASATVPRRAPHRLLTVSRLVPRKGVDDAIRAVALLDDVELLVAGGPEGSGTPDFQDDPEVRRLATLAADLGVTDRVRLLGCVPHDRLAPLLRSADAVVCLPWYEPFGIVPLEAMACGVPVVASAVGGLLDTVVDGVTGLHVPPRDPAAAAAAVRRLLGDPAARRRIARAAAHRAERYDWASIAQGVERTYSDAASSRADRRTREATG